MTVYEALFGTPERAAKTLDEMALNALDYCYALDALTDDREAKCRNCPYDFGRYGCEQTDMTVLQWLEKEVAE